MRKAKYVWTGIINTNINDNLTFDKVYDVIRYTKSKHHGSNSDTIQVLCDDGVKRSYFLRSSEEIFFVDIIELRNDVINGILL